MKMQGARGTSGFTAARIALSLALLMNLRTFQFFPGMGYVQEAWFVLCFLVVLIVYPFWKLQAGLRFSRLETYLLALIVLGTFLAAWRAQSVFGQPLIYGILAQRAVVLTAALLILVTAMQRGMVQLADVEAALLWLCWGTFVLYTAMRLLLNPASFAGYGLGFVTDPMPGNAPSFKLPGHFILFGVFYYAILGMRTRRARYYLAAAVLFPVTVGGSGRGLTVCVAATLLYSLYRIRGMKRALVAAVKFGFVAAILIGALAVISPAALSTRVASFTNAFAAVITGTTTQDVSANARIFETLSALPHIQEHPLLGNGVVSNQWQGGSGGALGSYFYPPDIGIIGVVYSYGALGLLLYMFQYRFAWIAAKKLPDSFHSPLLDATKAFILYSALYSLETGTFVWNAELTLFFVALLVGIAVQTNLLSVIDPRAGRECGLQKPVLSA